MQLRAFTFAWPALPKRQLAATVLAGLGHVGIALLVLAIRHEPAASDSVITDIVMVSETAPETEAEPDRFEPEEIVPAENVDAGPASQPSEPIAASAPLPPVSARAGDAETADADIDTADAYPISSGTRSVLQGLQCPGDPDAFALTGICPQSAGRHTIISAADEGAAEFYAIDVSAIRAMFGVSPHSLSGQATLDGGTQRRGLSNSDSIRDALPSGQPDPAFGD